MGRAGRLGRFEATRSLLADEDSRALLEQVVRRREGRRARLPLTEGALREGRAAVARDLRTDDDPLPVADPYLEALPRYRVPVPGGALTLHSDDASVHATFVLDQYGHPRGVRAGPGDVVVDAGGGVGDTALHFASLVGPGGAVHCFEMDAGNRAVIARNLELNPELGARVRVVPAALWHESGREHEYYAAGRASSLRFGYVAGSAHRAPTITLDDYLRDQGLERVDFVKADVEGSELHLLRGAEETLRRWRPKLAVAVYHEPDDLLEIPRFLADLDLGYRLHLGHFSADHNETVLFARAG